MALTYGFYNSYNGDRMYDAEQFSSFLDGIITDGIYSPIGTSMRVTAGSGMKVIVGTGRAWLDHTWTLNSTEYTLSISAADTVHPRIDAVVLEVNKTDRKNYLKIIKGNPASSPARPELIKTNKKNQYALAYIRVPANSTSISASNITNVIGTSDPNATPLVTGLALSGLPSGGNIGQVLAKSQTNEMSVGWYDIDKLPMDKWYLTDGISESNVLGAFKFIHQSSDEVARNSKNSGTLRALSKTTSNGSSITWNTDTGFTIPPYCSLHNTAIWNAKPVTMIAKFSDAGASGKGTFLSEMNDNRCLYLRTPYGVQSYSYLGNNNIGFKSSGSGTTVSGLRVSTTSATSGIVGITWENNTGSLYFNGSPLSVNTISDTTVVTESSGGRLVGMRSTETEAWNKLEKWTWNSFKIQYIVFYDCSLSAQQHSKIRQQIVSDSAS